VDIEHLNLMSLAGMPININGIGKIYPIKLKEIAEIGDSKYNQYLNHLCISIDSFNIDEETKNKLIKEKTTSFMLILSLCIQDDTNQFLEIMTDALKFFLKKEVILIPYLNGFFIGTMNDLENILNNIKDENDLIKIFQEKGFINNDNYEVFKKVIMLQNCIEIKSTDEKKYANDKAKEIAEKLKKAKEKINKIKAKQGEILSLYDLVSAFSANSKSNNIIDVWEMSIYQFNDQFKRMQMIEEYNIGIRSLLAGADSNKINLKHWITKINKEVL